MEILRTCLLLLLLASSLSANRAQSLEGKHTKSLLVLNSYHSGLSWTDEMHKGFFATLKASHPDIEIFTEYLNAKRLDFEVVEEATLSLLRKRYRGDASPEVVVVFDNQALEFMTRHRKTLFPSTPIVYAGINFFSPAILDEPGYYAGVPERTDPAATIRLMKALQPQLERLFIIADQTATGHAECAAALEAVSLVAQDLEVIVLDQLRFDSLSEELESLHPQRDAILLTVLNRDASGKFLPYEQSAHIVTEASRAPVYGLWDFYLGTGVLGGHFVSAQAQGRAAGEIVVEVLEGRTIGSLQGINASPNEAMIDWPVLKRFGIPESRIPQGVKVRNREPTFLERHGTVALGAVLLMSVEAAILLLIIYGSRRKQRQAEAENQETARRNKTIVEGSPHWVQFLDPEGRIITVNENGLRALGRDPDEVIGRLLTDICSQADQESIAIALEQARGGSDVATEVIVPVPGRNDTIWDMRLKSVLDAAGACRGIVVIASDVTLERETVRAMQASQQRLQFAIEGARVCTWDWRLDTDELLFGEEWAAVFGEEAEAQPRTGAELLEGIHPQDIVRVRTALEEHLQNPANSLHIDYRILARDGQWMMIRSEGAVAETDRSGRPLRLTGLVFDVSELDSAQRELRETNEELARANRRLEFAIARANQLAVEAQSAVLAKSQFLANMTHEIRTPLNAVLGFAQVLDSQTDVSPFVRERLGIIRRSGEHLLALISDILDLSRIESGRALLRTAPIDLRGFLQETIAMMMGRAQDKGLKLHLEAPALRERDPVVVEADERALRQVLLNLLGNAIKFTDTGEVSLAVHPIQGDSSRWHIEVRDTGCGIAPEDKDVIFKEFGQGGGKIQRAGGTGLGLAISSRLVEAMGGNLGVESTPGEGSRFFAEILLPPTSGEASQRTDWSAVTGYEGATRRILVVDDEPDNRRLLNDLLKPLGFDILEVASARQAIAIFEDWMPDLVLTDIRMGEIDGVELCARLGESQPMLPVVALTAQLQSLAVADPEQPGFRGVLAKPVDRNALLACLQKVMGLVWRYRAVEEEPSPGGPAFDASHPPEAADLQPVLDLAVTGDLRAVISLVDELAQIRGPHPWWDRIRDLAQRFQAEAIMNLLQSGVERAMSKDTKQHVSDGTGSR